MAGNHGQLTSPRTLNTVERRLYVLALRRTGMTYEKIARAAVKKFGADNLPNGWDKLYAYKDVKREIDKIRSTLREDAGEIVELELQRLDEMLVGLWAKARRGNTAAIDRVLKIMERRAKFLGIDAPERRELTGAGGEPLVLRVKGFDEV